MLKPYVKKSQTHTVHDNFYDLLLLVPTGYSFSMRCHCRRLNDVCLCKGGFTQNPVTAYDPAYGQRQSSHKLGWPNPGEFSRFRPASGLLKIVLSKPDCRCCR